MTKRTTFNFENYTDFNYDKKIIKKISDFIFSSNEIQNECLNKEIFTKKIVVDFVFCDDKFIKKINKTYRNIDNPTDVISFALYVDNKDEFDLEEINLGEIIISVDTAKKQAVSNNHSLDNEIYYLVAHGLLHLLGFDHQTQQEYNFMVDVQNKVMEALNYE